MADKVEPIVIGRTREQLHEEAAELGGEIAADARHWARSKPPSVRKLVSEFPPDRVYRVKEGAPYEITGPGTIGTVVSYHEEGVVGLWIHVLVQGLGEPLPPEDLHDDLCYPVHPAWLEADPAPGSDD